MEIQKQLRFGKFLLLTLYITACKPMDVTEADYARQITVRGNSLTIEWKNPVFMEETKQIKSYKIYIKTHGARYWNLVDTLDNPDRTSYTIQKEDRDSGQFDIGISVISTDNKATSIHSSLDDTADPPTGWYILWIMD